MKKRLTYIVPLAACCMLFTGCDKDTEATGSGDKARVQFMLSGSYAIPVSSGPSAPQTRAAEEHPGLHDDMLQMLDDGRTLWLAVYEMRQDGTYLDEPTALQSYVVRRSGNGYSTLYTCTVNPDGSVKSESDKPLYLDVGKTYKFCAVSPARTLYNNNTALHVRNGEYLLSTDDRYQQTESTKITIPNDGDNSGITYVYLNPLLHQTAQLQFSIGVGKNVHRLEILPAGIEVSGLQDDKIAGRGDYNWLVSDPLKMYLGNKHSRITIKEFTTDEDGCIMGQTSVLPTDATSSPIAVLLNLSVNGINSQYTLLLNGMQLEAAHSYKFNIKVKIEDNVTVAVWQNQSWEWDVPLQ